MSSSRLLWIGHASETTEAFRDALETQLEDLVVDTVDDGRQGLDFLSQDPSRSLLVVIDMKAVHMDLSSLVTGIKQINPTIEILVMAHPEMKWNTLGLPRYYRPIFLSDTCGPDVLISCVAKLKEMVEVKEHYAQISRGISESVGISRTSSEALLRLLNRQQAMGIFHLRRDGFFASYNREAERLTGHTLEEVAHIHVWCQTLLVDYESVRLFLAAVQQFWATKTGRENLRLRIKRKDGRVVTISMTMVVLLDNLGKARHIVALFYDPMESWTSREYDALLASGTCGVYTYVPGKGFARISMVALDLINRAFGRGLEIEEILGRQIRDLPLPTEIAHQWQRAVEGAGSAANWLMGSLEPMGLPGRRIMEHAYLAQFDTGADEPSAVLGVVAAREDLRSDAFQDFSGVALAEMTLETIPRSFVYLRSVRDDQGSIQDFRCIAANPAALRLLGISMSSPEGIPVSEVFSDERARITIAMHALSVCETGGHANFEIWAALGREKSEDRLFLFWLGKVADGAAVFFHDVTAIREEENRLKHYRHVFSHMDEAIIVTDLDGNIIDWNPASERMFGYTKSEVLGRPASILTQTRKGRQLEQNPRTVLRDGDVWKGEYEFVRSDGTKGIAFSIFALLKDDKGNTYGTVGLSHDLTERKRLEERLTVKSRELQEKNLALNTLLRHAEAERVRSCEQVVADLTRKVTDRVYAILEARAKGQVVETQANLLLQDLGALSQSEPLDQDSPGLKLSGKELEVAQLIRLGKTTEEIAFILDKSPDTIRLQRISIRKKLGISSRDRSLANYLKKVDLG